ncbi:MAG: hypothetical protein CMP21_09010 [Rickettsiales bacterium]|nr:hypothetical protein [Rickettsiales bacterium]
MVINRFIFHFAFIVLFQGFVFGLGDNQHIGAELSTEDVVNSSQISFNYTDNDPLLDQSKSTIVSEDLIRAYSFSESLTVTSIPVEYQQYLYVDFVDLAATTLSDRIIIKGFNKLKGRVYVNDHEVPCDQNGFFSFDYQFIDYGKQVVYVTFTTLNNQFITLKKKFNYLYEPEFLLKNVALKRDVTYFYNTDLFYSIKDKSIDDSVTRADLAYFLMILSNSSYDIQTVLYVVNDVFEEDWYYDAVNYVLHNQLMGEFLDGNFYPERVISKLELLVTLARFLNQNLLANRDLGFQDFSSNHWSSKFIAASLKSGLIEQSSYLNPDQKITLLDFVDIVSNMQAVKDVFLVFDDLDQGYNEDTDVLFQFLKPVVSFLEDSKDVKSFQLDIVSHRSNDVVYQDTVVLEGTVFPSLPFFIDSFLVTPNILGNFSHTLNLEPGANSITISRDELSNTFTMLYLNGYDDLSGHWLEDLAAKLNYLDLLMGANDFQPKMRISRYEFIVNSYPFFYPLISEKLANYDSTHGLGVTESITITESNDDLSVTESITITDLEDDSVDKDYLYFLIENDVFSLFEDNQFYPDRTMTRIEAIAAIVKFMTLVDEGYLKSNVSKKFPFWDVSSSHWGRSYLETAYNNNLISKNNNFYPDKYLTKDQLIALLSKTTYAKKQLALVFSND